MSLLTVGTVAFDEIETPFGSSDKILGGAATYIALSASFIDNTEPKIVSVIGDDFPQKYKDIFTKYKIDTTGVKEIEGGKTFYWKGKYHTNMNNRDTLDTQLNVLADFNPELNDEYKNSKYVMLGNLHPLVQLSVIDQLSNPEFIALDTMNFWMDNTMEDLLKVIKKVDCIIINDEEARQLTEENALKTAAKKIMEYGPSVVVIKKGEHGALLFDNKGNEFAAPALPLETVFDPTGAGDTFAGGFMGWVCSNSDHSFETLKQAVIYGSGLASFCVEKFGVEKLLEISKSDLNERINTFKKLTQFSL